jgi:hypothetical protein
MQRDETRLLLVHFCSERRSKMALLRRREMVKKLILGSVAAVALLGVTACSDSGTDNTTTQSTNPPASDQSMKPATPPAAAPTTGDNTTKPAEPAPATPAPAQ